MVKFLLSTNEALGLVPSDPQSMSVIISLLSIFITKTKNFPGLLPPLSWLQKHKGRGHIGRLLLDTQQGQQPVIPNRCLVHAE